MSEAIEKTLKAGEILRRVIYEAKDLVREGVKIIEVAEFIEKKIEEFGAKPAFPCNISINCDAAHSTPKPNDERTFQKGDLVKIDAGAHIDGYIADMAISVDLGNHQGLIKAAKESVEAAIDTIKAGVNTAQIGEIIEDTIKSYGYKPVINLTGHGLLPYIVHAPPNIPNYAAPKGVILEEGMVIAVEPFATDGVGKVGDRNECEIYSLINIKPVRMKPARELIEEITEKYRTLPFARRWIKTQNVILSRLVKDGIIRSYPVLAEISGGKVSQWEHTVIVEKDSARVVTK